MSRIIKNFKNIKYGPAPEDDTEVIFYNASSKASLYQWRKTGTQEWQAVDLSPQESRRIHIG